MKRLLLLFACFAGLGLAQAEYVALYDATLSGAASVVTVQAPATSAARTVRFTVAYVYCSVACDLTLERTGTAATATALAPAALNSTASTALTKAWRSSDVGAGTVIGKYSVPAGGTIVLDIKALTLSGAGTSKNLTLRTSAITGSAKVAIQFTEER
jgi:hypothetical protein